MNAAETIAAAIRHMEGLRDAYAREASVPPNRGGVFRDQVISTDGLMPASEAGARALVETLYRTIDAQLAILHGARFWADLYERGAVPDAGGNEGIILARAILGDES